MNLRQIGFNARDFYDRNNEKLTIEGLANWLGQSSIKPHCPAGPPYFICDPADYDTGEKVFAYCVTHKVVLLGTGETRICDGTEFNSALESNLFSRNNVAENISQIAAKVTPRSSEPADPNPTGTWTSGDPSSVYSRLSVRSSGTFRFETVDFTGDVKGGYSGTWRMDGKSVRF